MPLPAGTGLSRRSFLLRSGMAAFSVYGASRLGLDQLRAGIASAQGSQLAGARERLPRRRRRRAPDHPSRQRGPERPLQRLPPGLRARPRGRAPRSSRTATGAGTRRRARSTTSSAACPSAATRRSAWPCSRRSATPTPTSRTSPPATTGRSASSTPNLRTGWMGRLLDRIGTDDNPLQGLSHGRLALARAWPRRRSRSPRSTGPTTTSGRPGVWDDTEVSTAMFEALENIGDAPRRAARRAGARPPGGSTQQATRRSHPARAPSATSPRRPPTPTTGSARTWPGSRRCCDAGLDIRCAALSAAGGYDTHDNQDASFGEDLGTTAQALKAFQQDLEAKGLADRVITLVWSEFGRRPHENGSGDGAGTDHGAAGSAFLFGKRVRVAERRRHGRPRRPRRGRQHQAHGRLPRRLLASSSTSGSTTSPPP